MIDSAASFNAAMGRYQQEVVRWNRQINLVSRQNTLRRVAELISQCRSAWLELEKEELGAWEAHERVWYFDLGSGGGLPGFVWHQLLTGRFQALQTWLVEPREKRAWFLERLNQIAPSRPLMVWNSRWGEHAGEDGAAPDNILISLKALRLADPIVLAGLSRALARCAKSSGGRVVIARFYPPGQQWNRGLGEELEIPGETLLVDGVSYAPVDHRILPSAAQNSLGAAVVLSTYRFSF